MPAGEGKHLLGVYITGHHQGGVVWRVEALVPVLKILDGQVRKILGPTDDGIAIIGPCVGGMHELLVSECLGLVFRSQSPLLLDYLHFLREFLGVHLQVLHTVGFQLEGDLEAGFLESLEVCRVIPPGECVFATTVGSYDAGKFIRAKCLRPLEHHVLEDMGNAGQPAGLVAAADLVPDL
jgi:hypothetical protein